MAYYPLPIGYPAGFEDEEYLNRMMLTGLFDDDLADTDYFGNRLNLNTNAFGMSPTSGQYMSNIDAMTSVMDNRVGMRDNSDLKGNVTRMVKNPDRYLGNVAGIDVPNPFTALQNWMIEGRNRRYGENNPNIPSMIQKEVPLSEAQGDLYGKKIGYGPYGISDYLNKSPIVPDVLKDGANQIEANVEKIKPKPKDKEPEVIDKSTTPEQREMINKAKKYFNAKTAQAEATGQPWDYMNDPVFFALRMGSYMANPASVKAKMKNPLETFGAYKGKLAGGKKSTYKPLTKSADNIKDALMPKLKDEYGSVFSSLGYKLSDEEISGIAGPMAEAVRSRIMDLEKQAGKAMPAAGIEKIIEEELEKYKSRINKA